ncbi:MAG TPA: protein kinase, partial [Longimicrobiales bacterium]|nr:protein kinase [Longimicrobiales bacterium]
MNDGDNARKVVEGLGPGFELVRELGRGATAVVYLVRDTELGRDLAVKVIRASFTHDEEAVARLRREARLVAGLQHPNIVRVFSARHLPDGGLALLMEHVPGRDLKDLLRARGALDARRTLSILRDVASALAYAHRRRIVHRDVKPENIYVDDEVGTARLADFGIARPWDRDARLTVPGEALGTPAYMSPEQIDGSEVDATTDVYSLGLVGYEMLAGEHPWEDDNLFNIIYKQKNEELPSLRSLRPDAPTELIRAVERALEKDRENRWASAEELLERLDSMQRRFGDASAAADPLSVPEPTAAEVPQPVPGPRPPRVSGAAPPDSVDPTEEAPGRWRRNRIAAAAAVLVALVLAAFGWTALRSGSADGWVSLGSDEPGVRAGNDAGAPPGEEPGDTTADPPAGAPDPAGSGGPAVDEAPPSGAPGGAGPPRRMVHIVGNTQLGDAGAFLPRDLGVRVMDALGNPVPDAEVRFEVLLGGGSVAPGTARTDSVGRAFARWRLGPTAGDQQLAARVPSAEDAAVVFEAVARAGPTAADPEASAADPALMTDPGLPAEVTGPPLAVGGTHVCAVGTRGSADCLGALDPTGGADATRIRFAALAAGVSHVCGLDETGAAYCWGANGDGQLGDGSRTDRTAPASVATPSPFSRLALGLGHTCGLDAAGRVRCWGRNVNGQLGDGSRDDRTVPGAAQGGSGFTEVVAGWNHTCALEASGRAHCWGLNSDGQLGDGSRVDRLTPTPVDGETTFSSLAAGSAHTCGLGGGVVWCWGADASGQLGTGGGSGGAT